MLVKVCVISASLRIDSNSSILANEFAKGALDAGHTVEKIFLADKRIGFCTGCLTCLETKKCHIHDDANDIIKKMNNSDVVVFATPIYYGGMSGQLKTLIDRTCQILHNFKFKDVYLILACDSKESFWTDNAIQSFSGFLKCDDNKNETVTLKGIISATGVLKTGDIKKQPDKMKEAYEMGKAINASVIAAVV